MKFHIAGCKRNIDFIDWNIILYLRSCCNRHQDWNINSKLETNTKWNDGSRLESFFLFCFQWKRYILKSFSFERDFIWIEVDSFSEKHEFKNVDIVDKRNIFVYLKEIVTFICKIYILLEGIFFHFLILLHLYNFIIHYIYKNINMCIYKSVIKISFLVEINFFRSSFLQNTKI